MRTRIVLAATAVSMAVAATVSAPAMAATDYGPVTVKEMKTIVSDKNLAPTKLGTPKANLTYAVTKAPGDVYCWNVDGTPKALPDGATMVGQGWNYTKTGMNATVGTTIYQYASAAKAAKAAKTLATADCPNKAAYTEDEGATPIPTDQSSDQLSKRHGKLGFESSYIITDGGKPYVMVSVYRPVGNAVVVSSGMAKPSQIDALAKWALNAANTASDQYAKAATN